MNNDLISREALKKELDNIKQTEYAVKDKQPLFEYVELPDLIKVIDNTPTVKSLKNLIIPSELIDKLASCVVDIVGNIDWEKAIETYKELEDSQDVNEEVIRELWNCRNELCLRCGKYEKAYCGACDDCRYNAGNMKRWRKDNDG